MKANVFIAALLLFCLGCTSREAKQKPVTWSDPAAHKSGFVTANGIKINYLDWGGTGPALILIHGYADNPHVFDDLAPAFTDHYRVVAYARRGHGQSDTTGPYNLTTLTEDLRGLMDALNISKAHLAGWSMGGNEITAMAGKYPDRVNSITYLEAAYDWGDPAMAEAFKNGPTFYMAPPASAMTSLDAWRAYQINATFPGISDTSRFEAYIRDLINIQPNGSVRPRMSDSVSQSLVASLFTSHREYRKVSVPALAIYAETMFDVHNADTALSAATVTWENKYMAPFRKASIERIRKELPKVEILNVPGTHMNFVFKSRQQVVEAMLHFLSRQVI
jgi:pimeloyl-ACP methyl ester carboxylesterase